MIIYTLEQELHKMSKKITGKVKINLLIFTDPSGSQSEESLSQATGTLHFYMLFESCMLKASFLLQD